MGFSTGAFLLIGILVFIALAFLLRSGARKPKSRKGAPSGTAQTTTKVPAAARNPYRSTSIVAGPNACEAVKRLGNRRFLVAENAAPQLPLLDCDEPRCTCKYVHHADRREEGGDRRGPPSLRSELHTHSGEAERRAKKRGRRTSDWE